MSARAGDLPTLPDADAFREWAGRQPEKWQLIDGNLVMMAGASRRHVRISGNLNGLLWTALRGRRCQPYQSDLAVRVDRRNEFYPDLVVDCGDARNEAGEPVLVAEVLSPSTEQDDRGRKWTAYRRLPTLRHYLLIAQDEPLVELYSRNDLGWSLTLLESLDASLRLDTLDLTLRLADIYEGVDMAPDRPV